MKQATQDEICLAKTWLSAQTERVQCVWLNTCIIQTTDGWETKKLSCTCFSARKKKTAMALEIGQDLCSWGQFVEATQNYFYLFLRG